MEGPTAPLYTLPMVSGFIAYLIVAIPAGFLIALWGLALRREHRRTSTWLIAWGVTGPYFAPLATGLTWLAVGDATPDRGHEPWPWYAAAGLYSTALTVVLTFASIVAASATILAHIGVEDAPPEQ